MLNIYLLLILLLLSLSELIAFLQPIPTLKFPSSRRWDVNYGQLPSIVLFAKKRKDNNNLTSISNEEEGIKNPVLKEINEELTTPTTSDLDTEQLLKLKVEASAPFRLFRQYLYFAMIGGGSLGTIVGIPQLIKTISNQNLDDLKTTLFNFGVNVGGIVVGVLLFLRERKQEEEKLEKYRLLEKRSSNQLSPIEFERRERLINLLPVEILLGVNETIINPAALLRDLPATVTNATTILRAQAFAEQGPRVTTTETTRVVSINDLHEKGKQNVIIITGEYSYIKDCLVDLRLRDQDLFSKENILVVPFCSSVSDQSRLEEDFTENEKAKIITKKGFQSSSSLTAVVDTPTKGNASTLKKALEILSAPYIGRPKQLDVWKRVIDAEFDLAEKQGILKGRSQGISIILNSKGKIIRRGIGVPLWDLVIKELKEQKK